MTCVYMYPHIMLMLMSGWDDNLSCFWGKGDIVTTGVDDMIHSTVGRLQQVLDLSLPMIDCQSIKPCNKWVNKFGCEALHTGKGLRWSAEAYKKQLVLSARGKANSTCFMGCVGGKVQTPKILLETLPNSFLLHAVFGSLRMTEWQHHTLCYCTVHNVLYHYCISYSYVC